MFLKYPGEVISISTSYIHSKSKISVIKKSPSSNKRFVIEPSLSQSDIDHATEIYTPYGRFKVLIMNDRLYLQCERRKSSYFNTTMHKSEFLTGSCLLVSDNLENKIQNYLIILNILQNYEEAFSKTLYLKANLQIKHTLSNCLSDINTCLELHNSLTSNPRTPNFTLEKTNLKLLGQILSKTQNLFITSYENKIK